MGHIFEAIGQQWGREEPEYEFKSGIVTDGVPQGECALFHAGDRLGNVVAVVANLLVV